jgi:hypothetical protein
VSDELERLYAREREAPGAPEAVRASLRGRVLVSVGAVAGATAATTAAAGAATTAGTAGATGAVAGVVAGTTGKLAVLVLAIGAVGGGAALVARGSGSAPRAAVVETSGRREPAAPPASTRVAVGRDVAPTAIVESAPASTAPAPTSVVQVDRPRHPVAARASREPAPGATVAPVVIEEPPSVVAPPRETSAAQREQMAEASLLADAWASLRDGDPRRCLELTTRAARAYPGSVMAEERDAMRVLAVRALGNRDGARALAEAFFIAYPTSVHRQKIERALP